MFPEDVNQELKGIKYKIEESRTKGLYTATIETNEKKQYVLSKYNPKQTIDEIIKDKKYNKDTLFILIGYNFGYLIEKIVQEIGKEAKIFVIEPDTQFLKEQQEKSMLKLEDYKHIKVCTGKEFELIKQEIKGIVTLHSQYNVQVIITPCYTGIYPKFINHILHLIKERRDSLILNHNTMKVYNEKFMRNILENIPYIAGDYGFEQHKDKYKDIPALIVSAGPSLDKNIRYIKDFKGLILTGGRSLTAVVEQGVVPDFLVSIDPEDISFDTFKENKENEIPLLTVLQVNSNVVRNNSAPQYYFTDYHIDRELLGIELPTLPMSGSVATLCLSAAHYMGCNPIVFIGQDMAFTGEKMHADSCTIENEEDRIEKFSGRRYIKEYYGGKVLSRSDYISFLRWFEDFIKDNSDVTYINATEGGAYIEGAEHITFKEVNNKYTLDEKIKINHKKTHDYTEIGIREHIGDQLKKLKEDYEQVSKAFKLSKLLKEEYEIYRGCRGQKIAKLNEKLEKVELHFVKKETKRNIGSYLFDSMYNEIMMFTDYKEKPGELPIERDLRIVRFNYEVYESMEIAFKNIIEILEETQK